MSTAIPSGYMPANLNVNRAQPADDERARLRLSIKERRAEALLRHARIEEIQGEIRDAENDAEIAAAEHVQAAAPLQEKLRQLDDARKAAIVAGEGPIESLETGRRDVLGQLAALNQQLTIATAAARERAGLKRQDLNRMAGTPGVQAVPAIEGEIIAQTASQEQVDRLFSLHIEQFFLQRRRETALKLRDSFAGEVQSAKRLRDERGEARAAEIARKMGVELAAVDAALATSRANTEKLRQQILAE